jgi:iron-sulfur cluster repair protein YtfE (RIC family)
MVTSKIYIGSGFGANPLNHLKCLNGFDINHTIIVDRIFDVFNNYHHSQNILNFLKTLQKLGFNIYQVHNNEDLISNGLKKSIKSINPIVLNHYMKPGSAWINRTPYWITLLLTTSLKDNPSKEIMYSMDLVIKHNLISKDFSNVDLTQFIETISNKHFNKASKYKERREQIVKHLLTYDIKPPKFKKLCELIISNSSMKPKEFKMLCEQVGEE